VEYGMAEKYFSPPHNPSPGPSPPGMTLPRPFWVKLNRLRTGAGLFRSTMHKWDLVPRRIADAEQRSKRPITNYLPVSCTILQTGNLVWRLSMMTLMWTGLKHLMTALNI